MTIGRGKGRGFRALSCGNLGKIHNYAKTRDPIKIILGGVAETVTASMVLKFCDNRLKGGGTGELIWRNLRKIYNYAETKGSIERIFRFFSGNGQYLSRVKIW